MSKGKKYFLRVHFLLFCLYWGDNAVKRGAIGCGGWARRWGQQLRLRPGAVSWWKWCRGDGSREQPARGRAAEERGLFVLLARQGRHLPEVKWKMCEVLVAAALGFWGARSGARPGSRSSRFLRVCPRGSEEGGHHSTRGKRNAGAQHLLGISSYRCTENTPSQGGEEGEQRKGRDVPVALAPSSAPLVWGSPAPRHSLRDASRTNQRQAGRERPVHGEIWSSPSRPAARAVRGVMYTLPSSPACAPPLVGIFI